MRLILQKWGLLFFFFSDRLYYQCIAEGMEYPVLYRRPAKDCGWFQKVVHYVRGNERQEEILLDWNEIAERFGKFLLMCTFARFCSFLFMSFASLNLYCFLHGVLVVM